MADQATRHAQQKLAFEDVRIPTFSNDPSVDTVSARDFANLVDTHIAEYEATQVQAYNRVKKALAGDARLWLDNEEDADRAWAKTWTALRPLFFDKFVSKDVSTWTPLARGQLLLKYGDNFHAHLKKVNDIFRSSYELQGTARCPLEMGEIANSANNQAPANVAALTGQPMREPHPLAAQANTSARYRPKAACKASTAKAASPSSHEPRPRADVPVSPGRWKATAATPKPSSSAAPTRPTANAVASPSGTPRAPAWAT